jgi:hypothetical protein
VKRGVPIIVVTVVDDASALWGGAFKLLPADAE